MPNKYKIEIRKHQIVNDDGNDIVVQCDSSTGQANYVLASMNESFIDITNDVVNLNELSLEWTYQDVNENGVNADLGIGLSILVGGSSYGLIFDWLYGTMCSHLNSFDVRITDLECASQFRPFQIKADSNSFCLQDNCEIELKIQEQDFKWHCIAKTNIYDNWQNWFTENGTKDHPCFLTCIDNSLATGMKLSLAMYIFTFPTIVTQLIHEAKDERDTYFRRYMGLGNFCPSPKIHDLILNVAMKCGLNMDTIFDEGNEEHNDCLFYPIGGQFHEDLSDNVESPSLRFLDGNIDYISLTDFLNDLAIHYNAEWKLKGNTIHFHYKEDVYNKQTIYDFTQNNDAYDICISPIGEKKARLYRYRYGVDDTASSEVNVLYSDFINFDKGNNNLMLEGNKVINSPFASTGFVRDGVGKDYITNAIVDAHKQALMYMGMVAIAASQSVIGIIVTAVLSAVQIKTLQTMRNYWRLAFGDFDGGESNSIGSGHSEYYTGAVRLKNTEVVNIPRILRWDGVSMKRAKVVYKDNPIPNDAYNDVPINYKTKYPILAKTYTDFYEGSLNNGTGTDYRAFNYPHYFDSYFVDNLFEKHESTINPNLNIESNMTITWKSCATCELMQKFGLFDTDLIQLNELVKVKEIGNYEGLAILKSIKLENNELIYTGKILRK